MLSLGGDAINTQTYPRTSAAWQAEENIREDLTF